MCGIAGWVGRPPGDGRETADRLQNALRHRGPDASGVWIDVNQGVGLVHSRLSIIDLDPRSNHPLARANRYQLVFNGEIYNYRQLRVRLEACGEKFDTQSDSEVLLAAYAVWGLRMVDELRGMYAFAIWDRQEEMLVLGRDPLGIKPLYYSQEGTGICFASELRALIRSGLVSPQLDRSALFHYLRWGSYQQPETPIEGVRMLEVGTCFAWKRGKLCETRTTRIEADEARVDSPRHTVRSAIIESVEAHMVSDVPVGLFLSAGMDSSLLAWVYSRCGLNQKVALTLGFPGTGHDESVEAARWADALGLLHVIWTPTDDEAGGLAHDFFNQVDQPGIDGFNTFCISSLAAREGCKVVLSGMGGDELFGGYPSFSRVPAMMRWHPHARSIPFSAEIVEAVAHLSGQPRLLRLAEFFRSPGTWLDGFLAYRGIFTAAEALIIMEELGCPVRLPEPEVEEPTMTFNQDQVGRLEMTRYLRNQLLRDSDAYSMAHGVELRLPLVDNALYRRLLAIDPAWRHRPGKQAIAEAFPELPEWITQRRKTGFSLPYDRWFETILSPLESAIPRRLQGSMTTWYRRMCLLSFLRWKEINLGSA